MDHLHRLAPVLVFTLCRDDQREVRKDGQLSSACSALAGGNILLCWTHLDRLPSSDSEHQRSTDLCLPITFPFYLIFILFSGSQSHRASFDNRYIITGCDFNQVRLWRVDEPGRAHLAGAFATSTHLVAARWLDDRHILLADDAGPGQCPRIYKLRDRKSVV